MEISQCHLCHPSHGHIQQLRLQIKQYTKGDKTINEYMCGLTSRFDQLALLGKSLDHEDKIEYIIDGLPEEYKSVTDQVEGHDTTPSIIEIHEKLINKEAKHLSLSTVAVVTAPVSAQVTTTRPKNQQTRTYNCNWNNKGAQQSYQP